MIPTPVRIFKNEHHQAFIPVIPVIILALILSGVFPASARDEGSSFTPYTGAELADDSIDLDVGYVPTSMRLVDAMFSLSSVGPDDFLIDLGSGDGRIVITAAKKFGTRGLGVDLNPKLVALSKKYAVAEGVADRTEFWVKDIFLTDIRKADVVMIYLLPEVNLRLRPKLLQELKPGARIVSHDYHMGEWRPDKTLLFDRITVEGDDGILYYWVVPAGVDGTWHWQMDLRGVSHDFVLKLNQAFQDISGAIMDQGSRWPLFNAKLEGDRIKFSVATEVEGRIIQQDYTGRVAERVITGTVKISGATEEKQLNWKALRSSAPVK